MAADINTAILVVDDNPTTRYTTSRVLRHAGFTVREAATGTGGINAAREDPVDLIVLDIDLPDIDGYAVCRTIRGMESTARVRVVYLSASFIDDSHKVQGFEAGADGFLTHPVEPSVLVATVSALLRNRAIELELEQLLERERIARDEAERANRLKDDFLATLSHELRSPLTAIVGWTQVAKLKAAKHPEVVDALDVINRNARLQAQLISDLLDVSAISAGKRLIVETEPVSLSEVIDITVESLAAQASVKGVLIVREVDAHVGFVRGDALRLQQIVSNLLGNAIKFSKPGGCVHVRLAAVQGKARLEVQDEGRGISASVLPRIFDRFWQEDTSSRRSNSGLGLGLSIVSHLTALHGGTIKAESEGEGKGARFTVELPLMSDADLAMITSETESAALGSGEPDLRGVRVLIVDDDQDGRAWVRHVLGNAGAETLDVGSVDHAISALDAFHPQVIVSDLAMPERNGFDLAASLRSRGNQTATLPLIALSAHASAEDRRKALDASFDDFLPKPPDRLDLLRAVRTAAG